MLLAGSVAYSVLPVASLPDVDYAGDQRERAACRAPARRRWLRLSPRRWSGSSAASRASTR